MTFCRLAMTRCRTWPPTGDVEVGNPSVFEPDARQRYHDALLRDEGFDGVDCDGLLAYCAAAIAGRQYGKFVFTRSVSAMRN